MARIDQNSGPNYVSDQTVQQDYRNPSGIEDFATQLIMRGVNKVWGDPVQEVNHAREQIERANSALQEGNTMDEAGIDLDAIDKVMPGYSKTIRGAENLNSFRMRRAFAQQVFQPQDSLTMNPADWDTNSLRTQLIDQGAHKQKPFTGQYGIEPSNEMIRQRTDALPPMHQEQFGLSGVENARNVLNEKQLEATKTANQRERLASISSNWLLAAPGGNARTYKEIAAYMDDPDNNTLSPEAERLLAVSRTQGQRPNGTNARGQKLPTFVEVTKHYNTVVRPALVDEEWEKMDPNKRPKDPAFIAARNDNRIANVVRATTDNLVMTAMERGQDPLDSGLTTVDNLMRNLEKTFHVIDDNGNQVTLQSLGTGDKAKSIRAAIAAQFEQRIQQIQSGEAVVGEEGGDYVANQRSQNPYIDPRDAAAPSAPTVPMTVEGATSRYTTGQPTAAAPVREVPTPTEKYTKAKPSVVPGATDYLPQQPSPDLYGLDSELFKRGKAAHAQANTKRIRGIGKTRKPIKNRRGY